MTISSEVRTAGPFVGNDSTTAFPFYFKVFAEADVVAVLEVLGVETVLVLDSDYTVALNADQNASPGGTLTLATELATGELLTLTSDVAYLQPVDLANGGGFYPAVINTALDRLTILMQQLFERLSRTLKFPISDGAVQDLPGRAARAGTVLAFDEVDGEPIAGPDIGAVGTVSANVAAINTVATNIVDVNTVATNVADVTNFSDVYYGPRATDPIVRNDGSPMVAGDMYFSTTFDSLRLFDGTSWIDPASGTISTATFTGDGVTTDFDLPASPGSKDNTQIYLGGVYQAKSEYELSGVTIAFDDAPGNGVAIEVVTLAPLPISPLTAAELSELHTLILPESSIQVPVGTSAERPTAADGLLRFNSTTGALEAYQNGAWGTLWDSTRLVKQTSTTDTTAGRMMAVGAFGLGSVGVEVSNANTLATTGLYKLGGSDTGVPATNLLGYNILHQGGGTFATQVAISYDDNRTYVRKIGSGVWGAWSEVYTTGSPPPRLGVGQTWQNLTASRAEGTTYTNSTGKPIAVQVWTTSATDADDIILTIGGIYVARTAGGGGTASRLCVGGIVPDGATYLVTAPGRVIAEWVELR